MQVCLKCGTEYAEPTSKCTNTVDEVTCGSMQWSYPPSAEDVAAAEAANGEKPASAVSAPNDDKGSRRK